MAERPGAAGALGAATRWRADQRPAGQTAVGASNHCVQGTGTAHETILAWQPFDSWTRRLDQSGRWEPTTAGTRLHYHLGVHMPGPR